MTNPLGLFLVTYEIGTGLAGAPTFQLTMTVDTPTETINGTGKITQATNPPIDVTTNLTGNYTDMTVMPNNTHILVNATGYPILNWPSHGGVGPVIMPNVQLQIVLNSDWQSGTACYKYRTGVFDNLNDWVSVKNVPVKAIASSSASAPSTKAA